MRLGLLLALRLLGQQQLSPRLSPRLLGRPLRRQTLDRPTFDALWAQTQRNPTLEVGLHDGRQTPVIRFRVRVHRAGDCRSNYSQTKRLLECDLWTHEKGAAIAGPTAMMIATKEATAEVERIVLEENDI
jgi:hypothetical protein